MFKIDGLFHYTTTTRRVAVSFEAEVPFVPVVGMVFGLLDDEPGATLNEVYWKHDCGYFSINGECDVGGWTDAMMESLYDSFVNAGYDTSQYDQNNREINRSAPVGG